MSTQKQEEKVSKNAKVKMKATSGHPNRAEGEEFEIHPNHVPKLLENKWAVDATEKNTKVKGATKALSAAEVASGEETKATADGAGGDESKTKGDK